MFKLCAVLGGGLLEDN